MRRCFSPPDKRRMPRTPALDRITPRRTHVIATASLLRSRTPARRDPVARADKLTIADICEDLDISRSTFYDWRQKGRAPKCMRLPNGNLLVRRAEYDRWLASLEDVTR